MGGSGYGSHAQNFMTNGPHVGVGRPPKNSYDHAGY